MNKQRVVQQGMVLPLTLIIIAILTMMASLLLMKSSSLVEDGQRTKDLWQAELAINNAEQRLFMAIMAGNESPGAYKLGNTQVRIDGTPMKLSNNVWISVQDQAGILSLRFLRKSMLIKLLSSYVNDFLAIDIVNSIIDYQRSDNKSQSYNPDHFKSRGAVFRSQDELMLIPGISAGLYNGHYDLEKTDKIESTSGLRELLAVSGSSSLNFAAMPNSVLKRVLGLSEIDMNTLNDLKARGNWSAVAKFFVELGWPRSMETFIPSPFYIIRFQYKGIKARGEYLIRATTLPPFRRAWYFPDDNRYFVNSDQYAEHDRY